MPARIVATISKRQDTRASPRDNFTPDFPEFRALCFRRWTFEAALRWRDLFGLRVRYANPGMGPINFVLAGSGLDLRPVWEIALFTPEKPLKPRAALGDFFIRWARDPRLGIWLRMPFATFLYAGQTCLTPLIILRGLDISLLRLYCSRGL